MAASATSSRGAAAPTGSRRIETTQIQALAGLVTTGEGERETIEVERPATGQLLGTVPRCTADDVELAVQRARAAQEQWRETSFAERRRILLAFHDLVFDRREELLDLLQLESGKARRHAFEEVLDVGIVARYYARAAERHLRTRRRRGVVPLLTAVWEHHHPVGVVGIITPWNYPLTLSVSDAVPAFAAGNAATYCCVSTTSCSSAATRCSTWCSSSPARRAATPSRSSSTSRWSRATTRARPSATCARAGGAAPFLS